MAHLRGLLLLLIIGVGIALADTAWKFLNPPPPRQPPPPSLPAETITFEADVYTIGKITRGGSFQNYEIKFLNATNGQDKLTYHKADSDEALKPFLGEHVTVTCKKTDATKGCYWLNRMQTAGHVILQN